METLVEWAAPMPLGLAAGWSGMTLGLSLVEAAAAGVASLTAGFAALRLAGKSRCLEANRFEPASFEADDDLGELLLEADDELLELTDPLLELGSDSRVVRLFARPEPTPGELVERITDFLGEAERPPAARVAPGEASAPSDASAALHAALANIRASLR